jgi:hypothetical protein
VDFASIGYHMHTRNVRVAPKLHASNKKEIEFKRSKLATEAANLNTISGLYIQFQLTLYITLANTESRSIKRKAAVRMFDSSDKYASWDAAWICTYGKT